MIQNKLCSTTGLFQDKGPPYLPILKVEKVEHCTLGCTPPQKKIL